MKKLYFIAILVIISQFLFAEGTKPDISKLTHNVTDEKASIVFYTKDISSNGLVKIYEALGRKAKGKVGIKLSFESPGAQHLDPQMLKQLIDKVNGTFIDSNGYSAPRNDTRGHLEVAKDHGFTAVGPVDILDSDGELDMPVVGGKHLKFHRTGSHFKDYDSVISIVHFKPHTLREYGGTIKNLTICLASISGKGNIHSAGKSSGGFSEPDHDAFLESMGDGLKAALDYKKDSWVFINVINEIKANDSCSDAVDLPDVGIVASLDPVAVDQAAIDITYGTAPTKDIRDRWESSHGVKAIQAAEEVGAGSRNYRMVDIDK